MDAFSERVPPHNIEAEQSVLGACLIDKAVLAPVRHLLKPEDFYADKHRWVYEAICRVHDRKDPVDMITVQSELNTLGRFKDIGEMGGLTTLINTVPTTGNTEAYARIVAEKSLLRGIQKAAMVITDKCYFADNPDGMKAEAMALLHGAVFQGAPNRERKIGPTLMAYAEDVINTASQGGNPKNLLQTGFQVQDRVMPMARGEVSVAVAASGIGKTTYEKNLQFGTARSGGIVKGYSLEMSEAQLLQKYWGMIAEINTMAIRRAKLTEAEIERTMVRVADIYELPLYFEAKPRMRWADIKIDAMAFAARNGKVDLITVDYLQILGDPVPRNGRRDAQLGEMVEEAKGLAMELDCHVCFLAQQRIDKHKPVGTNEDVTESRDIVRASDNVLFLTRPTEFDPDATITLPCREPSHSREHRWDWKFQEFKCGQAHPRITGRPLFHNVMLGFQGKQRMGAKSIIAYEFTPETGTVRDLPAPWPWDDPDGETR